MKGVDISKLTNDEVWRRFLALAAEERVVIADLVACLAEVDSRTLVRDKDWPSLFEYCVYSLHWSESAAYRRIRAARAVRRFPVILEMLRDGRLHLEGIVILHAFIDDADFASLLLKGVGLTTKGIERLVADRRRDPPVRDSMRFVGVAPAPIKAADRPTALELISNRPLDSPRVDLPPLQAAVAAAAPPPVMSVEPPAAAPLAPPAAAAPPPVPVAAPAPVAAPPKLVRIGFTADEGLHRMVLHAQQLMRHKYPDGSLEGIFRDALRLLIEKKDLGVRAAAAAARKIRRKKRGIG
ncbi:MAG: hypothetical protein Q8T11_08820 [Elusimicrobiota bacterium]|nr:hypothetical protein [Elusimicrobiota bacterium]